MKLAALVAAVAVACGTAGAHPHAVDLRAVSIPHEYLRNVQVQLAGITDCVHPECPGRPDVQGIEIAGKRAGDHWAYTGTLDARRWAGRTVEVTLRVPVDAGHRPDNCVAAETPEGCEGVWHTYHDIAWYDDDWAETGIEHRTKRLTVPTDSPMIEAVYRLQIEYRNVKLDDNRSVIEATDTTTVRRTVTLRLAP